MPHYMVRMDSGKLPHVVIVGAGFAGLAAARALASAPCTVTLVDRRNHHLFQPLLYQVAMAGLSPAEIAQPVRALLSSQKNARVILGDVTAVDVAARQVSGDFGTLQYDTLVLATGAQHSYFGHNEWETYAPGLKTLEQATEIRRRVLCAFEEAERSSEPDTIKACLTFAVVGAGPTGVELAGSIGEMSRHTLARDFRKIDPRATRVLLVEAGPRILSSFSEKLAERAARDLRELGVEILVKNAVTHIDERGIVLPSGLVPARTVLWAAGVQASGLGRMLGVPVDKQGRVIVQPDLTPAGHPELFVIGDTAHLDDSQGRPLPGLAPIAKQQGHHVGQMLAARVKARARGEQDPPTKPFAYFDKGSMATIGRGRAIAQIGRIELGGFIAWLMWLFIHILYLVGFKNRLFVLFQWAHSYLRFSRGARLIVGPGWRSFNPAPAPSQRPSAATLGEASSAVTSSAVTSAADNSSAAAKTTQGESANEPQRAPSPVSEPGHTAPPRIDAGA
jgi:NADH:ubiquinone reductase (H+-translocating)